MKKQATLREQVKETFRTYNFDEAWNRTESEREKLLVIMSRSQIIRMVTMTSQFAGKYNI